MVDRSTPTPASHVSGIGGTPYAEAVDESIAALWGKVGGIVGSVAGTNTVTGMLSPVVTAYSEPLTCKFKPAATNTGPVTIDVGAGARAVKRIDGTPLQAGDLVIDTWAELIFSNADNFFVLVQPLPVTVDASGAIKKRWTTDFVTSTLSSDTTLITFPSQQSFEAGLVVVFPKFSANVVHHFYPNQVNSINLYDGTTPLTTMVQYYSDGTNGVVTYPNPVFGFDCAWLVPDDTPRDLNVKLKITPGYVYNADISVPTNIIDVMKVEGELSP